MALTLSDTEFGALAAAQRVLLSPLDHGHPHAWAAAVSAALRPLLGHERVNLALDVPGPDGDVDPFYFEGFEASTFVPYLEYYRSIDPAAEIDVYHPVFTTGLAQRFIGEERTAEYYRSEVFHDYYRPNEMLFATALFAGGTGGTVLPRGRALWAGYRAEIADADEDARLYALLTLLHPAFEAGVQMLVQTGAASSALADGLDALDVPLLVAGADGRPPWSTAALAAAIDGEPDRDLVLARARALLGRATALHRAPRASSLGPRSSAPDAAAPLAEEVGTRWGRWRLRSVLFGESTGRRPVAAVLVERAAPAVHSPDALVEQVGLTPQQARVALLLAARRSTAEIAEALSISPHTVRRHVEQVLERLGVGSRLDVAEALQRTAGGP